MRDRYVGDEVPGSVRCLRRRALLPWLLARAGLAAVAVAAASAVLARPDGRRSIWRAALLVSAIPGDRRRLALDLMVAMVTVWPASPGGPLAPSP